MEPFSPSATTVNITVGAASANALVTNQRGVTQVRVANQGSAWTWIAWGPDNTVQATTSGLPIGPGVTEVLTFVKPFNGDLWFAAIAAGSNGIISLTPGAGI